MIIKKVKIKEIDVNRGQIEGLPQNPRLIRDERFKALKKSIEDAPEMLSLRELLVYPHEGKFVVIGGNMRLRACMDLGYKEVDCKVLDEDTPVEKLREYAIKDNESFGQNDWDILANEWELDELKDWGMECSFLGVGSDEDDSSDDVFNLNNLNTVDSDRFQITLVFDKSFEDTIKSFIKNKGKNYLQDKVLEICQDAEVK